MKLFLLFFYFSTFAFSSTNQVLRIRISDSINPGSGDFFMSAIERADMEKAAFLLVELDTPGGLLNTTRDIVKKMLNSTTPIVIFVGPKGAHAGSAGALITFASDVAAMAPGTNIGAAHPVTAGAEKLDETMKDKIANDTAAFAESLAKAKGRNTEWAIKAVKKSASIIAEDALKENVIDLMAESSNELIEKLSAGYKLKVPKGSTSEIPKGPFVIKDIEMSIKHRIVSFFADPNLAYLILSLGGLCIWVELTHPGLIFPGVLGAICIILSLVSFQMLPISYGALAFIFLGLGMMVAEIFLPTYGLMAIGGVISFIFGSLFLLDSSVPQMRISLSLIIPTATVLLGCVLLLGYLVLKSQKTRKRSGLDSLVGEYAEVKEAVSDKKGRVFLQGELWNALSETGERIEPGEVVKVTKVDRMTVFVKKE